MNIQDEFEKLREFIVQILTKMDSFEEKIKESKPEPSNDWKPRVGEIVRVSDNKEEWYYTKFRDYKDGFYFGEHGEFWSYVEPLNDPMVIQLIPHVPGDPKPYGDSNNVIVAFKIGTYDAANPRDFNWEDDYDEGNIVGWFDIT